MMHAKVINQELDLLLERDGSVVIMCEGIDDGFFSTIDGLATKYPAQSIELPCSENASVGMALGAATYGVKPVLCFQRVEFALLAIEQLVNNAGKLQYLSCGKRCNPSLFRFVIGRGWGQGPSHSQSLESLFASIRGLNVFMPVFPEDSEYIIRNFLEYNEPTISLEHRWCHYTESRNVSLKNKDSYIISAGAQLTLVAYSYNVLIALEVRELFVSVGIEIEVINMFRLSGDVSEEILVSVGKSKRLVVVGLENASSVCDKVIAAVACSRIRTESAPVIVTNKTWYSPSSRHQVKDHYVSTVDIANACCKSLEIPEDLSKRIYLMADAIDKSCPADQPNQRFLGPF